MPLGMRQLDSNSDLYRSKPMSLSGEEENESTEMDDLLSMLKTENISGSFASDDSNQSGQWSQQMRLGKPGTEYCEDRRISIQDTHL